MAERGPAATTSGYSTTAKVAAVAAVAAAAGLYIYARRQYRLQTEVSYVEGEEWVAGLPQGVRLSRDSAGALELLGQGPNGKEYKATKDGKPCAVKVFSAKGVPTNHQNDIDALIAASHPHVVQLLACEVVNNQTVLTKELVAGPDLYTGLHKDQRLELLWYRRDAVHAVQVPGLGKQIAVDVAKGLEFLHSKGIVHRDLRSTDVQLTEDYHAKIGDAIQVHWTTIMNNSASDAVSVPSGVPAWTAPELLLGQRTTERVDSFSFGVILWELVTGELPQHRAMREVKVGEECPESVAQLIKECQDQDPEKRPDAADIVRRLEAGL